MLWRDPAINSEKTLFLTESMSLLQGEQLPVSTYDIIRLICNDRSGLRGWGDVSIYIAE